MFMEHTVSLSSFIRLVTIGCFEVCHIRECEDQYTNMILKQRSKHPPLRRRSRGTCTSSRSTAWYAIASSCIAFAVVSIIVSSRPTRRVFDRRDETKSMLNVFHKLDENRFLQLNPGPNGLNNQLQCLHLAANLAIQYDRTLLIPPYAYTGSPHSRTPMTFEELFDKPNAKLSIQIYRDSGDKSRKDDGTNTPIAVFDSEKIMTEEILLDPNPRATHVHLSCLSATIHHALPKTVARYRDDVLLPLHPLYYRLARQVLHTMTTTYGNNILGMHIRRIDLQSYPIFRCSETDYSQLSTFRNEKGLWVSACTKYKMDDTIINNIEDNDEILSWSKVLHQLQYCEPNVRTLYCARDFDAVFLATNDFDYIFDSYHHGNSIPNLVTINDFSFVRETICREFGCSELKEFLVEEIVLVLSKTVLLSSESSVTDIVMHLRLHEWGPSKLDSSIYDTFDRMALEVKEKKDGLVINFERLEGLLHSNRTGPIELFKAQVQ